MTDRALSRPMRYQITIELGYLRADLYNRKTPEETRVFLEEVAGECIRRHLYRVLIFVHSSKPIFTVEKYGFSSFVELAVRYSGSIALLTDSAETRIAQDYAAMLARLRGANVVTFRAEAAAIRWLTERRQLSDRRRRQERGRQSEQRQRERRARSRDSLLGAAS